MKILEFLAIVLIVCVGMVAVAALLSILQELVIDMWIDMKKALKGE